MKRASKKQQNEYRIACGDNYRKRLKLFGKQARVCYGCHEILICDGPISFDICRTLDKMVSDGLVEMTGQIPEWMQWGVTCKH